MLNQQKIRWIITQIDKGIRSTYRIAKTQQITPRWARELHQRFHKIRRIYVDRGFCGSNAIKVFNNLHLKYLMPASKIPTVKEVFQITTTPRIVTDFKMKYITFNLVIIEEELENGVKEKRAFATNEEYNENDVNLAEKLFVLYGKRWGV
jgi:hypothetical protein